MLDWDDAVPSLPWTPAKKTESTTLKTPPPAFRKMQSRSNIKCENVGPWEHHEQSHHDPTCDKCVYARKRRFWMKLTPLDDASGCNTTWMCAKPLGTPDSEWGLGCKACAWSVKQNKTTLDARSMPYAALTVKGNALKLCNLRRHAQSTTHIQNAKDYIHMHCQGNIGIPLIQGAPKVQEFKQTWHNIRNVSGGTKSRKQSSMEWCLYEAWREHELEFMASATTVSIMLDERHGRLLIKYAATNKNLDVRVGCLALMRDAGATSIDVVNAVHSAVARFCTRGKVHPGINKSTRNVDANSTVQEYIRQRVEMFTADGAANEQLAGKMLHPTSLRGDLETKLPNMRLVIRDKAHATRRITDRTIGADCVLEQILNVIVVGRPSVSRLLKNSRPIACMFESEVAKQERIAGVTSSVRNMSFAKQRFDSTAKPLGRCLLNLDAVISTMQIVCAQRQSGSSEYKAAANFLNLISEARNLVLAGMLADACDECLVLIRFFDREAFRLEEMVEQIDIFRKKIIGSLQGVGA